MDTQKNLAETSVYTNPVELTDDPAVVQQRYHEERDKRLKEGQSNRFIDPSKATEFARFTADPWLSLKSSEPSVELQQGQHVKFLIMGAGFGGLCFAARLREKGIRAEDIVIVDSASGFGGTWYWNRYPGLECDLESYIYLPLLEETGYIPKHKYSKGAEIREYTELLANHYGVQHRASWRTTVKEAEWKEEKAEWEVKLVHWSAAAAKTGEVGVATEREVSISAQFVFMAGGILNQTLIPDVPGLQDYQGPVFHSSRWDYNVTGGSESDPSLVELKDKRVAVIGTGCSSVQLIAEVAKWAKELTVFQRTPASVDVKDNCETDINSARQMMSEKGWQRSRQKNFNLWCVGIDEAYLPEKNLVNDFASNVPTFAAGMGSAGPLLAMEDVPQFVANLHKMDYPRQQRIRDRVDELVEDQEVAQKLKPWYPSWCKRPVAHNDYLQTFNKPNVHLVDIGGKGIKRLTETTIQVDSQGEFPADIIIYGTGFRFVGNHTPTDHANIKVTGRHGKTLNDKWSEGIGTLHAVQTNGFPNFFMTNVSQGGLAPNVTFIFDQLAIHAAHIVSKAMEEKGLDINSETKVIVEPSLEAEEQWTMEVMKRATRLAGSGGCTPSFFNNYGARDVPLPPEQMMKMARGAPWGQGLENFLSHLEEWRVGGSKGLEIKVV